MSTVGGASVQGSMRDFDDLADEDGDSEEDERPARPARRRLTSGVAGASASHHSLAAPDAAGSSATAGVSLPRGTSGSRASNLFGAPPILEIRAGDTRSADERREELLFARATRDYDEGREPRLVGSTSAAAAAASASASTAAGGGRGSSGSAAAAASSSSAGASSASGLSYTIVDPSTLRAYLMRATPPSDGVQQCFVIRQKSGLFGQPLWTMFAESDRRFLLASRKRGGTKTSNYLLAMQPEPDRASDMVVAKLRANFTGSIYTLYDHGMSPEEAVTDASLRRELAVIGFDYDTTGPGKMRAAIPRVSTMGAALLFRPRVPEDTLAYAAAHEDGRRIMYLHNKRPRWEESLKAHVLDFAGRVSESSVKNFQLASDETGDRTILQFGRVGPDRFTMDFTAPLSPVQAFGIVLASLDGKLADSKTFVSIKSFAFSSSAASSASSASAASDAPPAGGHAAFFRDWKAT